MGKAAAPRRPMSSAESEVRRGGGGGDRDRDDGTADDDMCFCGAGDDGGEKEGPFPAPRFGVLVSNFVCYQRFPLSLNLSVSFRPINAVDVNC